MSFSPSPSQLRIIFWSTALAAVVGAAYSQVDVAQHGQGLFDGYSVARGMLTGAIIGSALTCFEIFVLSLPVATPLALRRSRFMWPSRRASFSLSSCSL